MSALVLKGLTKTYSGGERALHTLDLEVKEGELIVFTGSSGSGKSTVLRILAGLEEETGGEIYLDGKRADGTSPKERNVSYFSQNYVLKSGSDVHENLAYGLNIRKAPEEFIERKVEAVAELFSLTDVLNKKPKQLTGLQRFRVALGRTVVREPKLYLFDEPISGFDEKARAQIRGELIKLHTRLGATFLYATRSALEAMTLATRIVLLKDGFVQQIDTPQNLYDYPVNQYVASYIGSPEMNFLPALLTREEGKVTLSFEGGRIALPNVVTKRIRALDEYCNNPAKKVTLGVRPEDIHGDELFLSASNETQVAITAEIVETLGSDTLVTGNLEGSSLSLTARLSSRKSWKRGEKVELAIDAKHIQIFDGETGLNLLSRDEHYDANPDYQKDAAFVPLTPREIEALCAKKPKKK